MAATAAKVSQGLLKILPYLRQLPQRTIHRVPTRNLFQSPQVPTSLNFTIRHLSSAPTKDDEELAKKEAQEKALNANFEPDPERSSGKTIVNILNQETEEGIFFASYSCIGFRLSNGMRVMGPCAVFPRSILHWNISGIQDVSEASLRLFTLLEPKIDLLILGVGERENIAKINPNIIKFLRTHKINMEILSTDQALATFNFLNSEKRYVAAALIPPSFVEEDRFDDGNTRFQSLADYDEENLFKTQSDYDYIPPGHEEGVTDEAWEKRRDFLKESLYKNKDRDLDKLRNPDKYRE